MPAQSVRRTKWLLAGAAPFVASHPCETAPDELQRVCDIYGWRLGDNAAASPERVHQSRRGIIATFRYARVFIVAPQTGS